MADINKVFVVDDFYNDLFEVKLPIQHLERLFHHQDVKLDDVYDADGIIIGNRYVISHHKFIDYIQQVAIER